MRKAISRLVIAFAALALGAGTAKAVPVTVTFQGSVATIDPDWAAFFSTIDTLSGSFVYESSTPAFDTMFSTDRFLPFTIVPVGSATVGAYTATFTGGLVFLELTTSSFDQFQTLVSGTGPDVVPSPEFTFLVRDDQNSWIPTAALPQTFLPLANYAVARWFLEFGGAGGVGGPLTSLSATIGGQVVVPEPALDGMAALGLLAAAARRRARRAQGTPPGRI